MAKGREKAAVRLAQDIVREMYEAGLRPGDKYFSEAEALKRHGVARATLREALRFLEIQGVITVRAGPGGGSIVGQPDWINLASTLGLLLQFHQTPLSRVLEARSVIEPAIAELAARNATPEQIAELGADLDEVEASLGNIKAWYRSYNRFWRHLAESTNNQVLAFLTPALRALVQSGGFAPDEVVRADLLARMRDIQQRIAKRDASGARSAMSALEDTFFERISAGYPRMVNREIAWSDVDLTQD